MCSQQCLVQIRGETPGVGAEECYDRINGCDCWESQHFGSSAVVICFPKRSFKRKEKLVWLTLVCRGLFLNLNGCNGESRNIHTLKMGEKFQDHGWTESRIWPFDWGWVGTIKCHVGLAKERTWEKWGRWNWANPEFRKEEQSGTEDRKRRPVERKGIEYHIALSSVLKEFTGFHVENENMQGCG